MVVTLYNDPASLDVFYAVTRAPGREPAYISVRMREGDRMKKRIAPSLLPVRTNPEEAESDLRSYAKQKGWRIAGTLEI